MTLITGNTYPVKDQIRALGGKWDAKAKVWLVPDAKADQARSLVASAPKQAYSGPRKCRVCGMRELSWQEAAREGRRTGMQTYPVKLRRDGICYDCAYDN